MAALAEKMTVRSLNFKRSLYGKFNQHLNACYVAPSFRARSRPIGHIDQLLFFSKQISAQVPTLD